MSQLSGVSVWRFLKSTAFAFLGVCIFIFLFFTLLLGNVFQIITLIFYPISPFFFRKLNTGLAAWWWGMGAWFLTIAGAKVNIVGDDIIEKENAIILANHMAWSDIPVLFRLALIGKRLGHMKWFVKDQLKYVPGMGFAMMFLNTLFLKRSWEKDKTHICSKMAFFTNHNIPVWLMIFPEGTRFKKEKLTLSHKLSKREGRPELNRLLFPRTKGFLSSVQGLTNHCTAIYDFTIVYENGKVPLFVDLFLGRLKKVTVNVKRFDMQTIPKESKLLKQWLIDRFYEKEQLINLLLQQG